MFNLVPCGACQQNAADPKHDQRTTDAKRNPHADNQTQHAEQQ
jgi:hypothetical protein